MLLLRKVSGAAFITAAAVLAACEPTSVTTPVGDGAGIPRESCFDPDDPQCINTYPLDDDPAPTAAGYYIGLGYSMSECKAGMYWGDNDGDLLDDKCEYRLAHTFAPLLVSSPNDGDTSKEPYWVATYRPANFYPSITEHISILYLLAYHRDLGSDECLGCTAHYGDSEFIRVDLLFDSQTQHWQLWQAYLSAHDGKQTHSSELVGYSGLSYPHRTRGYPRVWVAINKHANYKSSAACDAGAYWTDSCPNNTDEPARVAVLEERNLGSGDVHFINSAVSESPYSYGGTEYFWNAGANFCGWHVTTSCAGSYGATLGNLGF